MFHGNPERLRFSLEQLNLIEFLQSHENQEIYQKAFDLIEHYFGVEDDSALAPQVDEGSQSNCGFAGAQKDYTISVVLQSTEALEFMKRDLAEFTQVVQHEAACTIAATASVVKDKLATTEGSSGATEKVRKGISGFLGVISNTFAPSPDKTIDCHVITLMATPSGTTEPCDSAKARLYSLQSDPATYCNEPDGPAELLEAWLSQFNLEEKKGEIVELLATSPSIRALYTKMLRALPGFLLGCPKDCIGGSSAFGHLDESTFVLQTL
ncbi:BSD domain-containing protein 1-like [Neopsephotus bourkii]|uniref:BSD domain-containing protein 1-like n=1 Tax=Neopsephotus bourkii TaxID=309878 RepID=UPI002AA52E0B|nr:BSD domain-containing protein 1-like [Neopsephotus bourkii]